MKNTENISTPMSEVLSNFDGSFALLTGNPPFPWQRTLYERFVSDASGNIPAVCSIPTGLGKTAVLAIWLIARLTHPSRVPRRLVYVVNRRTVVDQTTLEAEKLRSNLPKLIPTSEDLAISTLRGQFADNREWSMDPSRIAIICGTVDMIGSRLLFSAYGAGFRTRPLHAGFLGQDVLLVHDEAHLEPAFQALLEGIQAEQRRCKELLPFRVMQLSATARGANEVFTLTPDDKRDGIVRQRIHAHKTLSLHSVEDEKKQLAEKLVELAAAQWDSQGAILIFVRTVDDLAKVTAGLPENSTRQLTGTMRGLEREMLLRTDPIFARFLPDARASTEITPQEGTVYLVCTSAGEVGVNISADHLVCDLSTLDSMVQRFGRVNRFGLCNDTRIDVVHPAVFKKGDPIEQARAATLNLLRSLPGDANPSATDALMSALSNEHRKAAFAPEPKFLPASPILFDTWALTSIREKLPGRPPVADYLHGVGEWQPAEAFVAWRAEVGIWNRPFAGERDRKRFQQHAAELLEDYPLKAHELLRDRARRILAALKKLPAAPATPVWVLEDTRVTVTTLGNIVDSDPESFDGKTVLLPPKAGGLRLNAGKSTGLLDGSAKYDEALTAIYDVADEWRDHLGKRFRTRQWNDETKPPRMKLERSIRFESSDDTDEAATETWYWFVRHEIAEANAKSYVEYPLQAHLDDAREAAETITARLPLTPDIRGAVIFAAAFHDIGKDRRRWQLEVGNDEYPAQKWAKSGKRQAAAERSSYRHEFGSLLDVRSLPEFAVLSHDAQELALHLIAAHHGRARPHFPVEEVLDDSHPAQVEALAEEIPLRYARLQRKYGRWGLAYLESLVRAADYMASEKAFGA